MQKGLHHMTATTTKTETTWTLEETVKTALAALKGISAAKTARDNGRDKVSSFNRDMMVTTARAVVGGFFEAFSEKVSGHPNYKLFKGSVSSSRAMMVQTNFAALDVMVPKGKGWTLSGKVYATGEKVKGAELLASVLAGSLDDTSPLVLAKAASAGRSAERNETASILERRLESLDAFLMSKGGALLKKAGQSAETLLAAGVDEKGALSAELQGMIAKGDQFVKDQISAAELEAQQENAAEYRAGFLNYCRANMTAELAGELAAILSKFRLEGSLVEPTTNLQAVASAA
jgi:hypothetical protein